MTNTEKYLYTITLKRDSCKWYLELPTALRQLAPITPIELVGEKRKETKNILNRVFTLHGLCAKQLMTICCASRTYRGTPRPTGRKNRFALSMHPVRMWQWPRMLKFARLQMFCEFRNQNYGRKYPLVRL